ncbi:DNA polymerase-3 subunit alpha [Virgibacillus halotolerans]|nr:DNA polymerase-3 subunit alpha [Virgibacillus halotolerans]
MSKVEDIVEKVKSLKQSSFAITEHGNVFSAVKAHKLAKQHSLKHIYGIEFYVIEDRFVKDPKRKFYHLTVLAKNEKGRVNINELSSLGYIEGFYSKPRVDHQLLKDHKEGLVVLSGCMASEFQQSLAGGKIGDGDIEITSSNIEKAKGIARFYRSIFGEDYYLEVQSHSDYRQQKLNRAITDISRDLNIPIVVTADSHYADEEDFDLHGIFIQIGQNRESGETYKDGQLQSEKEARQLLKPALTDEEIDEAVRNTSVIADKCNVNLPLSAPIIPHIETPKEFESEADYLKHLCVKGWNRLKINKKPNRDEYQKRLLFEFDAITKMGFEGYYLLVESYANSVKRRGIARGSGGGSLVAYLTNIVNIDPVKYGLYFERFIDVGALDLLERGEMTRNDLKIPDFDLDFGREDRDVIIDFIINRYGEDKFVSLGQFGYIWDKTAIKDVGKVMKIPFGTTNKITKLLEEDTIEEAIEDGRLKEYEKEYPKLFDYAKKIAGTPKSFGIHPSGKAVTINTMTDYTAVGKKDETLLFQGDMHDTDDLGIVKIDILGLRTIDVMHDTLELIGKDEDYIAPQNLNFEDEKVLQVFRDGNTAGAFQFESKGMQNTLRKMQPNGLDDLGVANALFRPGSMKFIDDYVRRKNGEESVTYLNDDVKPILEVTYGIIVFQEQLIEIGRLANMKNPDLLRQATGKKDAKLMAKVKPELVKGLENRGWDDDKINELWDIMVEFSKYSFNKSHSFAYAMIAYMTAFLKTYHPKEFLCSLLNSYIDGGGQDKYDDIEKIFNEAKRLNVNIRLPIGLSESNDRCYIKENDVVYGIHLIKDLNAESARDLHSLSDNHYDTFTELLIDLVEHTAVKKNHISHLIKLDFFKEYGESERLLAIYNMFQNGKMKYLKTYVDKTKVKRRELLLEYEKENGDIIKFPTNEKIMFQKDKLGFAYTTLDVPPSHCVIVGINDKYTPICKFYQIKTGKEISAKIKKKTFFTNQGELCSVGDYIEIRNTFKDFKWRKGESGFYQDESEQELFVSSLQHIK